MPLLLSALKTLVVNLAAKYAAELLVKHLLVKLDELAKESSNTIDDDLVAILKKEQAHVVKAINAPIQR